MVERHLEAYVSCMRHQVQLLPQRNMPVQATLQHLRDNSEYRDHYFAEIRHSSMEGELLMMLGQNLVDT